MVYDNCNIKEKGSFRLTTEGSVLIKCMHVCTEAFKENLTEEIFFYVIEIDDICVISIILNVFNLLMMLGLDCFVKLLGIVGKQKNVLFCFFFFNIVSWSVSVSF